MISIVPLFQLLTFVTFKMENHLINEEDPGSCQPLFPRHRHLWRPYCPQLIKPEIMKHQFNNVLLQEYDICEVKMEPPT